MAFSWDRRIARAGELSQKHAAVAELLKFYQQLVHFQKSVYEQLSSAREHDLAVLLPSFPGLIALVKAAGSPALAKAAAALEQDSPQDRLELLESIWQHQVESGQLAGEYAFFAQALLQPYAEFLAGRARSSTDGSPSLCPFCGSKPQVAVLRPEGDGGKKSLVCSLCSTEWNFRRVLCPNCGEENKDHLPIFAAPDFDYVRIDACDTCRTYIKSIDLTKNGNAIPVVDELATLSLNLWAQENNYQKLRPNLFGV
ncbi:MAG TPA: formate dehydrogenase accessory protein FdhE [Candidatus Angelobacter sp.]